MITVTIVLVMTGVFLSGVLLGGGLMGLHMNKRIDLMRKALKESVFR